MAVYKSGQWLVGTPGDATWTPVTAKTLRGAKRCATNTYQVSVGGKIQVAQVFGDGNIAQVVELAVKHGYGNWVDAP